MRVATRIDEVRSAVAAVRSSGRRIGLVPTMGYLHEGHLSLVRIARARDAYTVVSIFVNPAQFGPGEDFERYPRDLERDRRLAAAEGVELLFVPSAEEIYPPGLQTSVRVVELSRPLCGRTRPGHFDGVALVVTKLLNIVRPDFSVFGKKDAQQAILIERLARDLHLPGEIVVGATVREPDGLAMSSRNAYLTDAQRKAAPALSRGLLAAEKAYRRGERSPGRLVGIVAEEIAREPLLEPEYVEIVDRETLEPWRDPGRPALLAAALRAGRTRLIDNVFLGGEADPCAASSREGEAGERKRS